MRKPSNKSFVTRFSADMFVDLLVVCVGKWETENEGCLADRKALGAYLYDTLGDFLDDLDKTPYDSHRSREWAVSRFENLLTSRMMSRAEHKGYFLSTPEMHEKYGYEGGTLHIELTVAGWKRYAELTKSGDLLQALRTKQRPVKGKPTPKLKVSR